MSRYEDAEEPANSELGRALWRRCRTTETIEQDAEYFLDLAAFADGRLDEDERERIAARIARDPQARADIAAARALVVGGIPMPAELDGIIARALAIDPSAGTPAGEILPPPHRGRVLHGVAQWGSLAAAIAFASWLGFAMGSDALRNLTQPAASAQIGDDGFLSELLDPSAGFLRDLSGDQQT
jgi:anti-sigma factor RsiW